MRAVLITGNLASVNRLLQATRNSSARHQRKRWAANRKDSFLENGAEATL